MTTPLVTVHKSPPELCSSSRMGSATAEEYSVFKERSLDQLSIQRIFMSRILAIVFDEFLIREQLTNLVMLSTVFQRLIRLKSSSLTGPWPVSIRWQLAGRGPVGPGGRGPVQKADCTVDGFHSHSAAAVDCLVAYKQFEQEQCQLH